MSEMMTFPDAWEEFEKSYGFTDNEEVYTNGARLIPSFRVKQWLDHLPFVQQEQLDCKDCIKHGGDWECDRVHCHKGDAISRRVIEVIDKFIPADPMKNDYTQGISVGLAIATRCIEEFSQETDESSQGLVKDLINRQDAKDAIDIALDHIDHVPPWVYDNLLNTLNEVPSVQPRKGKWIDYSDEGYVECPFCHSATNCDGNKDELHYCFSCGAELR